MATSSQQSELANSPPMKWVDGLRCVQIDPLYYEGLVDDLNATLELHRQETVSTFGCRTSYRSGGGKENMPEVCRYPTKYGLVKEQVSTGLYNCIAIDM